MCGRYTLFTEEEYRDIRQIIQEAQNKAHGAPIRTGEIYPTNLAPILVGERGSVGAEAAVWGFPNYRGRGVLINARSETAAEKPTFRKLLHGSRCVVPSTGFYEWTAEKEKVRFNLPETGELYMAGLCREEEGERRYVVLTTAANASVSPVHDRMPVLIPKEGIEEWILRADSIERFFGSLQPALRMEK